MVLRSRVKTIDIILKAITLVLRRDGRWGRNAQLYMTNVSPQKIVVRTIIWRSKQEVRNVIMVILKDHMNYWWWRLLLNKAAQFLEVLVTIDKQAKNACIIYKLHLILSIVSSCWHFVFRTLQWLVIIFWLSNYLWVQ